MKTERNIITMDEYGRIHFSDATAKNIWMSTNELIDLFGIIFPTLRANIKAIYKSGIQGAKEYKCIQWNKHRCLCTPDDCCSVL